MSTGKLRHCLKWVPLAAVMLSTPARSIGQEPGVIDYRLRASISPTADVITAEATVVIPEDAIHDGVFLLDITTGDGAFEVLRIEDSHGAPLPRTRTEDGTIAVSVPRRGDKEITVSYSLELEAEPEPFGYHLLSEDLGTRWYPEVLGPSGETDRFVDFDVELEYPDRYAVLTTGGLGDQERRSGVVHATYSVEHAEDFAVVAGEGYRIERYDGGIVPILAFAHPDYAARFALAAERTAEAAQWYGDTYGFFPVDAIGLIQGHPRWGGGFPLANMFMVHLGNLSDDFLAFITAHELGHYYWGLYVLGETERLDWLVLANGIWADQLYLAERSWRSLEEQWRKHGNGDWVGDYLAAVMMNREQRLGIDREGERRLDFDYNSFVRHGKAATGVFLQSRLVGYDHFLDLQRDILQQFRYRPLPISEFVRLLEQAGTSTAGDFFEAWQDNNASIEATVDEIVREDDANYRVVVRRTGTVPYPIEYVVETEAGTVGGTLEADARWDTTRTASRPVDVLLDPDGAIPMWNASHPETRSLVIQAMGRAEHNEFFIPLALAHLDAHPGDDALRYALARRLFWIGRWEEAADMWPPGPNCESPDQCRAAVYAARALMSLDRLADAAELLENIASRGRETTE